MKILSGKQIRLIRVNRPGYKPFVREQLVNKEDQAQEQKSPVEKVTEEVKLKRQMKLPSITAEQANKSSDIYDIEKRRRYRFKEGTKLERAYVFAGKGSSKEFRKADKWASKLGGKPEEWQHCAGWAYITDGKRILYREVHWVQREEGKPLKVFIKKQERRN